MKGRFEMKAIKSTLFVALLILVFLGAIIIVQNKNLFTDRTKQEEKEEQDPHEKQLAYLKKHEEEIKEFVKSQNSKIETVQIDWNETMWEEVGNGTPQGGGEVVIVGGGFNNIEGSTWQVMFRIKNEKIVFDTMMQGSPLRVEGRIFE